MKRNNVELKTKPTTTSVNSYLETLTESQQHDAAELIKIMKKVSGATPAMWGKSIVGFGHTHLKYASGRELDWFPIGFSARKDKLSLYLSFDLDAHQHLLDNLGKHSRGVGCLYIKRLADVDPKVLTQLISEAFTKAA